MQPQLHWRPRTGRKYKEVEVWDYEESTREAIDESVAETPVFWRFQYHVMTTNRTAAVVQWSWLGPREQMWECVLQRVEVENWLKLLGAAQIKSESQKTEHWVIYTVGLWDYLVQTGWTGSSLLTKAFNLILCIGAHHWRTLNFKRVFTFLERLNSLKRLKFWMSLNL